MPRDTSLVLFSHHWRCALFKACSDDCERRPRLDAVVCAVRWAGAAEKRKAVFADGRVRRDVDADAAILIITRRSGERAQRGVAQQLQLSICMPLTTCTLKLAECLDPRSARRMEYGMTLIDAVALLRVEKTICMII